MLSLSSVERNRLRSVLEHKLPPHHANNLVLDSLRCGLRENSRLTSMDAAKVPLETFFVNKIGWRNTIIFASSSCEPISRVAGI